MPTIVDLLAALPASELDALLAATELGEIWGIGRRIAAQLREEGLKTALDVARMDPVVARRRWSVTLERTVREMQGQACIALEDTPPAKKEIACTRSFGTPITELADLVESVTEFASRACEKLRRQDGHAGQVLVFIHTSPFRTDDRSTRARSRCRCADRQPTAGWSRRARCAGCARSTGRGSGTRRPG